MLKTVRISRVYPPYNARVFEKATVYLKYRTVIIEDNQLYGPIVYGFIKLEILKRIADDGNEYWLLEIYTGFESEDIEGISHLSEHVENLVLKWD
jgi:hypothetical protein